MDGTASEGGGRIARNFLSLFAAQAWSMVAGLISTAFLARALGTEAYGILGFGTALLSYFGLLVVFGTDSLGVRQIAQDREGAARTASTLLGLRTVSVAVVSVAYAMIVGALGVPERVRIVLWIQGAGLFVTAYTLDFVLQGLQRMEAAAVRQALASSLVLAGVLALIRSPGDLYIAAGIPITATGIAAAWLALRLHRTTVPFGITFDVAAWKPLLRAALPIAVAQFMNAVFLYVDIVMLGFMVSRHLVGLYVAVSRVLMISLVAAGLIASAFAPAVAAAWPDGAAMRARYRDFATAALFLGAPLAAAVMAFPSEIVAVLFGKAYLGGAGALVILMAMALAGYASIAPGTALVSWHDQTAQMVAFSVGAAVNVALNFVLIPRYGIEGAAAATLAAQLVVLTLLVARVRLRFGLFALGRGLALIAAAAAAAVAARLAADALPVGTSAPVVLAAGLAVGAALYLGIAKATGLVPVGRVLAAFTERLRPGG